MLIICEQNKHELFYLFQSEPKSISKLRNFLHTIQMKSSKSHWIMRMLSTLTMMSINLLTRIMVFATSTQLLWPFQYLNFSSNHIIIWSYTLVKVRKLWPCVQLLMHLSLKYWYENHINVPQMARCLHKKPCQKCGPREEAHAIKLFPISQFTLDNDSQSQNTLPNKNYKIKFKKKKKIQSTNLQWQKTSLSHKYIIQTYIYIYIYIYISKYDS